MRLTSRRYTAKEAGEAVGSRADTDLGIRQAFMLAGHHLQMVSVGVEAKEYLECGEARLSKDLSFQRKEESEGAVMTRGQGKEERRILLEKIDSSPAASLSEKGGTLKPEEGQMNKQEKKLRRGKKRLETGEKLVAKVNKDLF
ncbi:hypothetical protein NDU88_004230 [Pleurodeles waltl]|uniref:Uncharacterized protein n=1 Tax=Pleurodeles waltl TaxID=8319 RepID=A0AAV7SI63_PLEWA|nr:hypothetical protein NDU88_004230 [Pleurodeles waltl]